MGSAYWRRNARQRGSALAAANLFGPNCLVLASASPVVRPCWASTPSAASTRSAVSVCHAGTAAPDPGPGAGAVTGEVTLASLHGTPLSSDPAAERLRRNRRSGWPRRVGFGHLPRHYDRARRRAVGGRRTVRLIPAAVGAERIEGDHVYRDDQQ